MFKHWKYSVVFALLVVAAYFAQPIEANANGTVPPPTAEAFCNGTYGWYMDLNNNPAPANPNCGNGVFKVEVATVHSSALSFFDQALQNLRDRGGIGTIWYIKPAATPQLPSEPTQVSAPAGFCLGTTGWGLNLNTQSPVDPQCQNGTYRVSIGETLKDDILQTFMNARDYLWNNGKEGGIWFVPNPTAPEPSPVSAPENFCQGEIPWSLNLNNDIPQNPHCGDGEFMVEITGDIQYTATFTEAVDNLESRGKEGTLWFDPPIVVEPIESQAPTGFCDGTVGWGLNLKFNIPIDPQCPYGVYKVEVEGDFGGVEFTTLQGALANLTTRGEEGGIWFVPTSPVTFLPLVLNKLLVSSPELFCDGVIGWFLNLFQMTPSFPDCDNGSFVVNIGEESQTFPTFDAALNHISENAEKQGSIWFVPNPPEPVNISAPANFCKGTEGWTINLALEVALNPECGSGKFLSDAGMSKEEFLYFAAAVEYLRTHGGVGTLWYLD